MLAPLVIDIADWLGQPRRALSSCVYQFVQLLSWSRMMLQAIRSMIETEQTLFNCIT